MKKALLIGLGSVGYASMESSSENHFQAAQKARVEIVGVVESDPVKVRQFELEQSIPTYYTFEDIPESSEIDLIIIATPENTHDTFMRKSLIKFPETKIFCEKPFVIEEETATLIAQMHSLQSWQNGNPRQVWVNYIRQYSQGYIDLKNELAKDEFQNGEVLYNYGIERSCSHYIRLILGLLGVPKSIKRLELNSINPDNPSFEFNYGGGKILKFTGVNNHKIRIAEFVLNFSNKSLSIVEGSIARIATLGDNASPVWPSNGMGIRRFELSGGLQNFYKQFSNDELTSSFEELSLDITCSSILKEIQGK